MEREPQFEQGNRERERGLDFLDERIKTYVLIDPEAAEYLPKITKQDLTSKRERYRILMGEYGQDEQDENKVYIFIKSILEEDEELGLYQEGKDEVGINLPMIKDFVREIKEHNPEYRQQNLVGEIHTHPVVYGSPTFGDKQRPWHPSKKYFITAKNYYENRTLTLNKPFVFGIAGLNENGTTRYNFYKIIKRGVDYIFREISSQVLESES